LLGAAIAAVGGTNDWSGILLFVCQMTVYVNLALAFFNLIPIPPLDGSHVVYQLLPPRLAEAYQSAGRWGFLIILILVFFLPEVLQTLMTPVMYLRGAADRFMLRWI
jgi:Zn-dependent protease